MPDETPVETPPVETPPVETPPPPVEAPPIVEEEPAPVFSWEFPEVPAETPATPQPPADGEPDVYGQGIQQNALVTSAQWTAVANKNLAILKANLAKNGATDEVVAKAEEEFWSFGINAAAPNAPMFAAKNAYGAIVMEGKPVMKPKATVRAPGAPPVGNLPQPTGKNSESKALAVEVFNREMKAAGVDVVFTEEDFAEVE